MKGVTALLLFTLLCTCAHGTETLTPPITLPPPLSLLAPTPHARVTIPYPLRRGQLSLHITAAVDGLAEGEADPFYAGVDVCMHIEYHGERVRGWRSHISCISVVDAAVVRAADALSIDAVWEGDATFFFYYRASAAIDVHRASLIDTWPRLEIPFSAEHASPIEAPFDAHACSLAQLAHFGTVSRGGVYGDGAAKFFYEWLLENGGAGHDGVDSPLTVVDVGANVGANVGVLQTLVRSWRRQVSAPDSASAHADRIFLFEPAPNVFATLLQRVANETAATPGIVALPYAMSEVDGVAPFFVDPTSSSSEHGGLDAVSPAFTGAAVNAAVAPFLVPTRRLDTMLPLLMGGHRVRKDGKLDIQLLKIDTEGHDLLVLRGGANGTLQRARFIVFECSNLWDVASASDAANERRSLHAATRLLIALGFRTYVLGVDLAFRIDGDTWHEDFETHKGWQNCMAMRADDEARGVFERTHVWPVCVEPNSK